MKEQVEGNMSVSVLVVLSMDFPADRCLHWAGAQKKGLDTREKVGPEMRCYTMAGGFHHPQEHQHHAQGCGEGMKSVSTVFSTVTKQIIQR